MPIPYAQRRQRRQQLMEALPADLRKWIALRHVEAVAKFPSERQARLAAAIEAGIKAPAAIRFLKENPEATVDEIVKDVAQRSPTEMKRTQRSPAHQHLTLLADLLQTCFPDMPRQTASAMAGSDLLSEVLDMIRTQQACFESHHARSDFTVVVLCGWVLRTTESLNEIISTRRVYRQALQQSGLEWPF